MLLTCPSCNSQYLVNSIDLQPNGRKVRCATCEYEWFQKSSMQSENTEHKILSSNDTFDKEDYKERLPSTYVVEEKVSMTNSILAVIFVAFVILSYFIIKNLDRGILNLLPYYYENLLIYFVKSFYLLKSFIDNFVLIIFELLN